MRSHCRYGTARPSSALSPAQPRRCRFQGVSATVTERFRGSQPHLGPRVQGKQPGDHGWCRRLRVHVVVFLTVRGGCSTRTANTRAQWETRTSGFSLTNNRSRVLPHPHSKAFRASYSLGRALASGQRRRRGFRRLRERGNKDSSRGHRERRAVSQSRGRRTCL